MLGIKLSEDSKAAARWSLESGGEYYGVGAGTGISGFRANLGVGDDLFGSREDAYSETVRQKRWDWYQDDFSARLKPGAKRILMNTRWHEEDVAGRVLEQIERKEIKGRVISIPAIAEEKIVLGRAARRISLGRTRRLQLRRFPEGTPARDEPDDVGRALSAEASTRGRRLLQSGLAQAL